MDSIINNLNDKDNVAHYTKKETALKILKDEKIRLSTAEYVNDPYENQIDWLEGESSGHTKPNFDNFRTFSTTKKEVNKYIKLFCTSGYSKSTPDTMDNHLYSIPAMWAHYGENHKGVCFIFNKTNLDSSMQNIKRYGDVIADEVKYIEYMELINSSSTLNINEINTLYENKNVLYEKLNNNYFFNHRFYRKHKSWSYEREYRWLIFSDTIENIFIELNNSLVAIVLGSKMHYEDIACFSGRNIPTYKLKYDNGLCELEKVIKVKGVKAKLFKI